MDGQNYSQASGTAVLKALHSDKKGLTLLEAKKRLDTLGPNTLQYSAGNWLSAGVRRQVRDSFFLILLAAELAAWYVGDGHVMLAFGVALLVNVLANIGFVRHGSRFITHLERLLQAPVTVTRSGKRQQIDASTLVPGDIVHVSQGETVPADLRLLSAEHLVTDEYNISGSDRHTAKTAKIGEHNIALFGSVVVAGSGSGVVIALGARTVFGARLSSALGALSYTAGPTGQRLNVIRSRIAKTGFALLLALIILALTSHTTLNDFLLYAAVLAAALVPSGLAAELALSQRIATAPIAWIVRAAASDAGALLLLVIIGIIGQLAYHVPMAITAVQIIAVSILALLVPITALAGDRPKDVSSSAPARWLGFGLLSAALAYGNFLFFFERRGISPAHLDNSSTLYFHAATLSFVTIVLCRLASLLFIRAEHRKHFFTPYLWDNKGLSVALACSLFLIVLCIYYPPLRHYFDTQPLSLTDWLTALMAAAIFSVLHLLKRHTRQHTRKAIIDLHRQVHAQS